MDEIIKLNIDKIIDNISKEFGIKKNKLIKLYKNIKPTNINILIEYRTSILKVYENQHNKYLIIGKKKDDIFYALNIIE